MNNHHSHFPRTAARVLAAFVLAAPFAATAQSARTRVAVVPFIDGTGGSARAAGVAASQTLIDELAKGDRMTGVAIDTVSSGSGAIDDQRAIAIGRERELSFVFVGTVLSATSRESTRGGWLPRVKGNTLHVTVRSIEAKVELQGALYDVATGERLFTATTKGDHKDKAYSGRVWSSWGAWDVGDQAAFLASPMGKAFLEASREMVKRIDQAAASRVANNP